MKKSSTLVLFTFLLAVMACNTNNQPQDNSSTDSVGANTLAGSTADSLTQNARINDRIPTVYMSKQAFEKLVPQTIDRDLQKIMLASTVRNNVLVLMGWQMRGDSETDYDENSVVNLPDSGRPFLNINGRDVTFSIQKIGHAKVVKIKKYLRNNPGIYLEPQLSAKGFLFYKIRGVDEDEQGTDRRMSTNPSPPATARRTSTDPLIPE